MYIHIHTFNTKSTFIQHINSININTIYNMIRFCQETSEARRLLWSPPGTKMKKKRVGLAKYHLSYNFTPIFLAVTMENGAKLWKTQIIIPNNIWLFFRWGDYPSKTDLAYIRNLVRDGKWFNDKETFSPVAQTFYMYAPSYVMENEAKFKYLLINPYRNMTEVMNSTTDIIV